MKKLNKYRLYCLTNMYLSSIQKGIQTAHVIGEIFYTKTGNNIIALDWSEYDKTIIVLNGGNCNDLHKFEEIISNGGHNYPYAWFCEDHESLNGATTAVGIILPEKVYSGKTKNAVERKIYNWIKNLPLAI